MVKLETILAKELTEEKAGGEAETTLEMSGKDHPLTVLGRRYNLVAGEPALHSGGDPSRLAEVVDIRLTDLSAVPSGSGLSWWRFLFLVGEMNLR